jgi:hypothetical protein
MHLNRHVDALWEVVESLSVHTTLVSLFKLAILRSKTSRTSKSYADEYIYIFFQTKAMQ